LGLSFPHSSVRASIGFLSLALLFSCSKQNEPATLKSQPIGPALTIQVPLGLPPLPIPTGNKPTAETVALGRTLFYDPILSRSNKLSCATCHNPALMFVDRQRVSTGDAGVQGVRNSLSILNAAYYSTNFWDGRAGSLEDQAGNPMANRIEMNQPHEVSVKKLNGMEQYRKAFARAFGPGPVTLDKIRMALASFERTLLSGDSPFDRYKYGHDPKAMTPAAIRGLAIFTDKKHGNCATCHTIGEQYALFTDEKFHNIGIGVDSNGELTDLGRFVVTHNPADKGAFRTPSLRNVALTPPYMHDGSEKTLDDVIEYYQGGGNSNPYLDKEIHPLDLSARDREDLLAFLKALTGEPPANAAPPMTASR
jgi:cytochrome c peroxidase